MRQAERRLRIAHGSDSRPYRVPQEYNATLKKSQTQLLERTTSLTELVDRLRAQVSESAAAGARLARDMEETRKELAAVRKL